MKKILITGISGSGGSYLAEHILNNYKNPDINKYESFLKKNNIEIAGIEYITDKSGTRYTYDVNTNTNYNSIAEKKVGQDGMLEIAKFLKNELKAFE